MVVMAAAVVDGVTEVMGPPGRPVNTGARRRRAWSCSQPSPSSTRRTTGRTAAPASTHPSTCSMPTWGPDGSMGRRTLRRYAFEPRAAAGRRPGRRIGSVKVSTRGDYASRALLSLALHGDAHGPTSVRDIAERTGLPQPYLEQILLALKGAGLVRSKRGVGGGYVLARPPEEITLGQIVSAVDGPIVLGDFGEPHKDGACDHEGQCVLLAVWAGVGDEMRRLLDGLTLADVAAMARGQKPWPAAD